MRTKFFEKKLGAVGVANNDQIAELQAKWEAIAIRFPDSGLYPRIKAAVAWLREDESRSALDAERRFMGGE